ncbi:hypothetical protein GCM10027056_27090 [Glaciibacter psychrotolerans]
MGVTHPTPRRFLRNTPDCFVCVSRGVASKQGFTRPWGHMNSTIWRNLMPDKSPHRHDTKKPGKSIKEKRANKRAKTTSLEETDAISHLRKVDKPHHPLM